MIVPGPQSDSPLTRPRLRGAVDHVGTAPARPAAAGGVNWPAGRAGRKPEADFWLLLFTQICVEHCFRWKRESGLPVLFLSVTVGRQRVSSKSRWSGAPETRVPIPPLSLRSCVTLGESLGLSESWAPPPKMRVMTTAPGAREKVVSSQRPGALTSEAAGLP